MKNPMFQGAAQHDAQELLQLVLDVLHEDLNLVKEKEYVEWPDQNGKPDEEYAAESLLAHKKRNQSKIQDLTLGLMRSHLACPECGKESVKFDPFAHLSPSRSTSARFHPLQIPFLSALTGRS